MKIIKRTKALYYQVAMIMFINKLLYAIMVKIAILAKPWIIARFYAAWEEYQKGPVYKERLYDFGLAQAITSFIEDKWTRDYCLKTRLEKEPGLKWRLLLTPSAIEAPSLLVIAAENGLFRLN
jgi:hypothetical protein